MKFLILAAFLTMFVSCKEESVETKEPVKIESAEAALPDELQDPEDCDEKLEKLEEEPVEISLGENPDAGCTIE